MLPGKVCLQRKRALFYYLFYMQTQNEAGNLLPQNEPQLAKFIQAQSHIRAAAHIIDEIRTQDLSHLGKKLEGTFKDLCEETHRQLWEAEDTVSDLSYLYHAPLFPIDEKPQ